MESSPTRTTVDLLRDHIPYNAPAPFQELMKVCEQFWNCSTTTGRVTTSRIIRSYFFRLNEKYPGLSQVSDVDVERVKSLTEALMDYCRLTGSDVHSDVLERVIRICNESTGKTADAQLSVLTDAISKVNEKWLFRDCCT